MLPVIRLKVDRSLSIILSERHINDERKRERYGIREFSLPRKTILIVVGMKFSIKNKEKEKNIVKSKWHILNG